MDEKRAFRRYAVEVNGELLIDGEVVAAETNDISEGGCGLIVDRPVPETEALSLTLFLTQDGIEDANEQPLETTASVMWAAPRDDGRYAAGLQFKNLSHAGRLLLERFLRAIG